METNNKSEQPSAVNLLLSKHITITEEENEDFITLHVYNDTNGEKIYSGRAPWKKVFCYENGINVILFHINLFETLGSIYKQSSYTSMCIKI